MRRTAESRIGERFGRLVVQGVRRVRGGNGRVYPAAACLCDCGREKVVRVENLINRAGSKSCGCLQREVTARRCRRHGASCRGKVSREYRIWSQMIARCTNPQHVGFADYGGRGVAVCQRWRDFANFAADMGAAPSTGHTIERDEVNGNYEPGNCRWLPARLQAKNTRRVRRIVFRGETLILTDWAIRFGVGVGVLSRLIGKVGEVAAMESLAGSVRPWAVGQ